MSGAKSVIGSKMMHLISIEMRLVKLFMISIMSGSVYEGFAKKDFKRCLIELCVALIAFRRGNVVKA